jgi:hypothetical protein
MYEETRKGLFTSKEQEFIAAALYFWLQNKIKSAIFRMMGKKIISIFISVVDDYGLDRIPEKWKLDVIPIISAAMDGEKEKVRLLTVDLLNKKIDIPKMDDEQELMIFDSLSKFIATAIDLYLQKRK